MDKKKLITLLLALTMILSLATGASAAETTEARVPVTLTVVNTVSPISCTVPACLPVSLVDGYVVCANNAAITNTGKIGAIKVTKVDVQAGTFEIGNFDDCDVLSVTVFTTIVLSSFLFENDNFSVFCLFNNRTFYGSTGYQRRSDGFTHSQYFVKNYFASGFASNLLNFDNVIGRYFVLLAACFNYCIHFKSPVFY